MLESFSIQTNEQIERCTLSYKTTNPEGDLQKMQNVEQIREDLKNSQDSHLVKLEAQLTDEQIVALMDAFKAA